MTDPFIPAWLSPDRRALDRHRPYARESPPRRPPRRRPLLRCRPRPTLRRLTQDRLPARLGGAEWIERYAEGGADALADRSHVARGHPHKTPPEVEALVVEARQRHPTWGPRKLIPWIAKRHPDVALPAASTVGTILKRHGLVEPRRRRRVAAHPGSRPLVADAPGDVWTADCARIRALKGQFRTGDGVYGRADARPYPLTVCDAHSRYVLCCDGHESVEQYGALRAFDRLFREHGLPHSIRTDNGTPFATQAICGLSRLSVWWIGRAYAPPARHHSRPD